MKKLMIIILFFIVASMAVYQWKGKSTNKPQNGVLVYVEEGEVYEKILA